jgi:hypothetical protein
MRRSKTRPCKKPRGSAELLNCLLLRGYQVRNLLKPTIALFNTFNNSSVELRKNTGAELLIVEPSRLAARLKHNVDCREKKEVMKIFTQKYANGFHLRLLRRVWQRVVDTVSNTARGQSNE